MSTFRQYHGSVIPANKKSSPVEEIIIEEPMRELSLSMVLVRVIYVASSIIIALLSLRFVLTLMGADPTNAFANFIHTTSQPFVAPFLGLFNYKAQYGGARFEVETLIATAVYAILAALVTTILTIPADTKES